MAKLPKIILVGGAVCLCCYENFTVVGASGFCDQVLAQNQRKESLFHVEKLFMRASGISTSKHGYLQTRVFERGWKYAISGGFS